MALQNFVAPEQATDEDREAVSRELQALDEQFLLAKVFVRDYAQRVRHLRECGWNTIEELEDLQGRRVKSHLIWGNEGKPEQFETAPLEQPKPGLSDSDPYTIIERRRVGMISKEQMIEELIEFPYEVWRFDDRYPDDIQIPPEESFASLEAHRGQPGLSTEEFHEVVKGLDERGKVY